MGFKKLLIICFLLLACPAWAYLNFDNADDAVDLGSSQDNPTKLTIFAWVYAISLGEGSVGTLWIKDAAGTTRKDFRFNSTNTIYFRVARSGGPFDRTTAVGTPILSHWFTMAVTWDGGTTDPTTSIHIYINGVEAAYSASTTSSGAVVDDATATEHIGNRAGDTQTWNGGIALFCQWQDALTANQILNLSKGRDARSCLQTNYSTLKVVEDYNSLANGKSADLVVFQNLRNPGTSDGTADNGANNTGMTSTSGTMLSYPSTNY